MTLTTTTYANGTSITREGTSPMKNLAACVVEFAREQDGPWETGIAILESAGISDIKLIIDQSGNPILDLIWDYRLQQFKGCFQIHPDELILRD